MSTKPSRPGEPPEPPGPEPSAPVQTRGNTVHGTFVRRFLEFQLVFVVFILIASIPEPPSPYARLSAPVQVGIIVVLWVLSDAAALAVRASQVLRRRTGR